MKKSLYTVIVLLVCFGVCGSSFLYYKYVNRQLAIVDFVYERDIHGVQNIIDENWYWLFPETKESYPLGYVNYVFKYRAPQANPLYCNRLIIKVLRIEGNVAGFVGYYMEAKKTGRLLLLAVKKDYRGKQYGEKLARYAQQELLKLGASQVTLLTRADNLPAQRIYRKLGFYEILNDGRGFVHFMYEPGGSTTQ